MIASQARSRGAAYVFDPALQRRANEAGLNYWYLSLHARAM
jgi:hypothetical protein